MVEENKDDGLLEDSQTLEIEAETTGRRAQGNRAGLEDILVQHNQGGAFNVVKETITGSDNPAEYWVRTNLTADEIQDDVAIMSELQWAIYGYEDVFWAYMCEYHLRRSLNGAAMNMAADMHMGAKNYTRDMIAGAARGGILRRANTMNNEQIEPNT
jgi:hypothetical protein